MNDNANDGCGQDGSVPVGGPRRRTRQEFDSKIKHEEADDESEDEDVIGRKKRVQLKNNNKENREQPINDQEMA